MSQDLPKPTDAELAILRVLWDRGASTVREVHDQLRRTRAAGYTTILKLLQIMTEKGLVTRDETARSHVYSPRGSEAATQQQLVADLMTRAFGGSAARLVMQALETSPASADEMNQIQRLLDERRGARK
jgi:predicted transcriptional regulator